jgi:D-serine deaminase-like pyridoxal phosphate-dependent protein
VCRGGAQAIDLGSAGLSVATVGEAEVFAEAGFTDLFIAYPIWAAGARGKRLRALAERATLRVAVVVAQGTVVDRWRVAARGANT